MTRVLLVNHTSTVSGAELVLLDTAVGFTQAWPGTGAYLFERGPLADALAARGVAIQIARWGGGLSGVRRDSPLWRAAAPLAGRMAATVLSLARAARAADVVYANSQKAFVLAALASRLARRNLVWHLHDIIDPTHFGAAQRRLQIGLANSCAAAVVVPSDAAAEAFVAAGGRRRLVIVVPNGLDLARDPAPRAQIRAELGLPPGPLIGVFSRLAEWKGQQVALDALARLPGTRAILAGAALFDEHAYEARLRARAAQPDLAGRVEFLGQRSDVGRLMQAVDVVVHPSIHPEPFGRTLVEAMLLGTQVVATDAGAAAAILDHGRAGTLVPPGDPAALAVTPSRPCSPTPIRTASPTPRPAPGPNTAWSPCRAHCAEWSNMWSGVWPLEHVPTHGPACAGHPRLAAQRGAAARHRHRRARCWAGRPGRCSCSAAPPRAGSPGGTPPPRTCNPCCCCSASPRSSAG